MSVTRSIAAVIMLFPIAILSAIHNHVPTDNCEWTSKNPPSNPTCNHGVPDKCDGGFCVRTRVPGIWDGLFWVDWYCHCIWNPANIPENACQCDGKDLCAVFEPTETDVQRCVYFYVNVDLSYDDAQDYCVTHFGTDLATLDASEKIEIAQTLIGNDDIEVWTGLHSTHSIGWFEWKHGACANRYGSCIDEKYWVQGHPRCLIDEAGRNEFEEGYCGDGYSFVTLNADGQLDNKEPGDKPRPFLCNSGADLFTIRG